LRYRKRRWKAEAVEIAIDIAKDQSAELLIHGKAERSRTGIAMATTRALRKISKKLAEFSHFLFRKCFYEVL